jgi:hypothetical protein
MADVGPKVRYWSWILLPLLVWLAAGAARGWNGRARWLTRASLATLLGVQALAVLNSHRDPRYAVEDIRSAAGYLEQHASIDEPIFVVSDYMAPPLRYYLNGEQTLENWLPHVEHDANEQYESSDRVQASAKRLIHPRSEEDVRGSAPLDDAALNEWLDTVRFLATDDGRFWLVYSRPFHGDPEGKLLTFLLDDDWITLNSEFAGVKLYRGEIPR